MAINVCNNNVISQLYTEIFLFDAEKGYQTLSQTLKKELFNLSMYTGNEELYIKALPEDIRVKSVFKENDAGGYYKVSVSFKILDHTEEVRSVLNDLTKKRLVIVLQNDMFKTAIGNDYESFSLSYEEIRPTKQSDDVTYKVTLTGQTITPIIDQYEPGTAPSSLCVWTIIHN